MNAGDLIRSICEQNGVTVDQFRSSKRSQPLTLARQTVAKVLHAQGFSIRECSRVMGIAYCSVTYHLYPERRENILKYAKERYAAGKLRWARAGRAILEQVAKDHGISVRDLREPGRFKHLVKARVDAVARLRAEGLKVYQIATALNCDSSTVSYHLYPKHRANKKAWIQRQRAAAAELRA